MAQLDFEIGSVQKPRGHALIYFGSSTDPQSVVATYVIVPPISFDLTKYIPPMIANRMPQIDPTSMQFVPLPPLPETVESHEYLRKLAEARGDDLVYGGVIDSTQLENSLLVAGEACREYAARCHDYFAGFASQGEELNVNEVLYGLMGERDKLGELAKLVGKLRYAIDGNDSRSMDETVREMRVLGRLLPPKFRVDDLIRSAQQPGDKGGKLAALYLDRCYRIASEDYRDLEQIDRRIQVLESDA